MKIQSVFNLSLLSIRNKMFTFKQKQIANKQKKTHIQKTSIYSVYIFLNFYFKYLLLHFGTLFIIKKKLDFTLESKKKHICSCIILYLFNSTFKR